MHLADFQLCILSVQCIHTHAVIHLMHNTKHKEGILGISQSVWLHALNVVFLTAAVLYIINKAANTYNFS